MRRDNLNLFAGAVISSETACNTVWGNGNSEDGRGWYRTIIELSVNPKRPPAFDMTRPVQVMHEEEWKGERSDNPIEGTLTELSSIDKAWGGKWGFSRKSEISGTLTVSIDTRDLPRIDLTRPIILVQEADE